MIQRIQSLYLLLSIVISVVLPFFVPIWKNADSLNVYVTDCIYPLLMFLASGFLSLLTIMNFKNRKRQFIIGRLNIILNFLLLGLFVYLSLNLSGEIFISEKGIGMSLPLISIVFLALANKAIKKDEDLVKSVDRIR